MRKAVIVGGTGQIGRAVARALAIDGWRVVCAQRGEAIPAGLLALGVEVVACERGQKGALERALGDGADALIDTVAFGPEHARQLLALQGNVGAFAVISSASVYQDAQGRTLDEAKSGGFPDFPDPIAETQPRIAPGEATYSTRKAAMEDLLLDGARGAMTILRPGAIYGPGARDPREWWFVRRLLDGRRQIPLAWNGESRFHVSSTANIAALCLAALARPGVRVLNTADPIAPTVTEIGAAIMEAMGVHADFAPFEGRPKGFVGWSPWSIERPLVLDMTAAAELGYQPATTYPAAIAEVCRDLMARADGRPWRDAFPGLAPYPDAMFEYDREDAFLASTA